MAILDRSSLGYDTNPKSPHSPWTIFLYTNNHLRVLGLRCKEKSSTVSVDFWGLCRSQGWNGLKWPFSDGSRCGVAACPRAVYDGYAADAEREESEQELPSFTAAIANSSNHRGEPELGWPINPTKRCLLRRPRHGRLRNCPFPASST